MNGSFWSSFETWLHENFNNRDGEMGPDYKDKFAFACWYLCKLRCNRLSGSNKDVPYGHDNFIEWRWREIKRVMERGQCCLNRERHIRSTQPVEGWLNLNTNEASRGTLVPAGGGGILRNRRGDMLEAFAKNHEVYSSFQAASISTRSRDGPKTWYSIPKLIVNSDSASQISLLKEAACCKHPYYNLITGLLQDASKYSMKLDGT